MAVPQNRIRKYEQQVNVNAGTVQDADANAAAIRNCSRYVASDSFKARKNNDIYDAVNWYFENNNSQDYQSLMLTMSTIAYQQSAQDKIENQIANKILFFNALAIQLEDTIDEINA